MTYAAVDTAMLATRTAGDVQGQVIMALIKQAVTRVAIIGSTDRVESAICRSVLDGSYPASWTRIVLGLMDIAGNLGTHTDAQCDTAVVSAWAYFMSARTLT